MDSSFTEKLSKVRDKIVAATAKSGRNEGEVKLIAVSKGHNLDEIKEAKEVGLEDFGENKIQEALAKIPRLAFGRWHFIGHLQSNKVRQAVNVFDVLHSIDSLKLAEEVSRRAGERGKTVQLLLQVNVSGEIAKFGVKPKEVFSLSEEINKLPSVEIVGLMTMAPFSKEAEGSRAVFSGLRELRDEVEQKTGLMLPELSMGMSRDFVVAIEEGGTMVRVGSALFGERRSIYFQQKIKEKN